MAKERANEGGIEKTSRRLRNIHWLGAAALVGAAVIVPEIAGPAFALAELGVLSGGGLELARRHSAKRRPKS